ncbi:extracellular solute-binding protein [Ancylobacter sp. MQZ15Z-1]|uniref:Extracellular solute-binding protein n=1 Tax=Ancylobacter mangrovi TaxID=2972472 RepID=A0A9X2T647_9HYPH|nr:extracellular solute-binding protein [Ancylobacter mangrovi]MCS0494558.1 extracellular solute-binding protein [Ancylobacter mangrovi]
MSITRRAFNRAALAGAGLAAAGPFAGGLIRPASAAERLLVVQWGAQWIEVSKQIAADFNKTNDTQIAWELHSGGSAAVIAKIKAVWPNTQYNVLSVWDPVFRTLIKEDWLVPIDESIVTNLATIPDQFIQKNDKGQKMTVPLSTAGAFWGYRDDLLPGGFDSIEDLLRPEFKGKLCVPYPINLTGLFIVSCAIQRGGDEKNAEPGWDFVKELASKGQIGEICTSNSEYINAMATGQYSVGFWNNGGWFATAKNFPVKLKNRMPDNKGFLYNEGFCVLKGCPEKAAFEFANFFAEPKMNELYNMNLGSGPTQPSAKTNPMLVDWYYKPDELAKYAYFADFAYLSSVMNEWNARWEREIVPLVRRG